MYSYVVNYLFLKYYSSITIYIKVVEYLYIIVTAIMF